MTKMKDMKITKEQFSRYEGCRLSGATNMFDLTNVKQLTGLNREQITTIMNNYVELNNQYK